MSFCRQRQTRTGQRSVNAAQTPNEPAAGRLLDEVTLDPRAAKLLSFLKNQPLSELPGHMEKITPDGDLKAIYEIGFSGANIQKLALEDRLDDTRNAFNASLSTRPTRPRPLPRPAISTFSWPANGWIQTLAKYKPHSQRRNDQSDDPETCTVGSFLDEFAVPPPIDQPSKATQSRSEQSSPIASASQGARPSGGFVTGFEPCAAGTEERPERKS